MEENTLANEEEKMLVGILYNHLSFGTTMEVLGELNEGGVKRLDNLRNIFSKLVKKFGLSDNIDESTYLLLGLANSISKSALEKFAKNDKNKHLQNRAKYFLNKINKNYMENKERFPKIIKIGNKLVGEGQPAFFIAEIGANFDNGLERAKQLALAAKDAGADCVKFQSFLSDKIVSGPSFAKMQLKGVHGSWEKPIDQVFKEAEFPREWHKELFDYCNKIGIMFSSAPYDFEAVDLLNNIGVDFFKIGSGEITWYEMLEYIAKKGKPMFLATGDSTLAEVDEAVRIIENTGNNQLVLMQCITNYPSKVESANINVLKTYQTAFDIVTGYSDHSPGDIVVLGSVALGAKVIEKHFTLNKKDAGPDHPHSMEPEEFKQLIEKTRLLEKALGTTKKDVVEEEQETVVVQRRSLHAKNKIEKGQIIRKEDIIELRPAVGIPPKFKAIVVGKKVKIDIGKYEAIYWDNIE